jgi:hypothetical protein
MTKVASDADAHTSKEAVTNASPPLDPEAAAALEPWPISRKGNPWFKAREWVFVAHGPRWDRASWRLWIEGPSGKSHTHRKAFATLEALQRFVATFLIDMPKPAED